MKFTKSERTAGITCLENDWWLKREHIWGPSAYLPWGLPKAKQPRGTNNHSLANRTRHRSWRRVESRHGDSSQDTWKTTGGWNRTNQNFVCHLIIRGRMENDENLKPSIWWTSSHHQTYTSPRQLSFDNIVSTLHGHHGATSRKTFSQTLEVMIVMYSTLGCASQLATGYHPRDPNTGLL